jgi:hypothetical protein
MCILAFLAVGTLCLLVVEETQLAEKIVDFSPIKNLLFELPMIRN